MTEAANAYGQALYDLAKDECLTDAILAQLLALKESFAKEPDFLILLQSANLSKQERCAIIDDSFKGKLHDYVVNFLKILTERNYAKYFDGCVEAYRRQYNSDNNILPVTAVSAVALTKAQSDKLSEKLAVITGKKIELINRVDPGVLGGIRLDYDGKRLDDTVSNRLEAVRASLRNTVL